MSWNPLDPHFPEAGNVDSIELQIIPRTRDLGGFEVRRALPAPARQMVGPFIFFDQMGPAEFLIGGGIDVRPHPHIGLATVTYLYNGEFQHRDSLGTNQMIYPGEVNWMIAGRGVTHSERTSETTRRGKHSLFGIQTWVALPEHAEETNASFEHYSKEALPFLEGGNRFAWSSVRLGGPARPSRRLPKCFMLMWCSRLAQSCLCRTTTKTVASMSPKE
ncbi:pirin family protein [Rhizobium gallicum]|uniref:pirin family protein n=1 Tax=Rhizobium gallicum TaxID=56730 RepID=UPI000AC620E9